ncbi:MAG TPA: hypothetical protein VN517_16515 [Terriglobales bacterium]|jgi:hypothetical protein|nr:hypothetical protein [Terriglobales bacterium]
MNKAQPQAQVWMAVTALLCLACSMIGCHGDRRESFYSSLADAKKAGAVDRGWIPDFLPESSRNVHELHTVSSPTTWCAFEFDPTDSAILRKSLKADAETISRVRSVPNPDKFWWPVVFTGNIESDKVRDAGFDLYALVEPETLSSNEVLLFAINWDKGSGFFYRTPIS